MIVRVGMSSASEGSQVSVCLPVHNGAQSIERALDSLWQQTYPDFEVIVFDDGSIDDTPSILARQSDRRLKVIRADKNLGQARATTAAVRAARSPLIKLLHADDALRPRCLEICREGLIADADVGMVCTRRAIQLGTDTPAAREWRAARLDLWRESRELAKNGVVDGHAFLARFLGQGAPGNWIAEPSGVMVRRSVLETVGGMHLISTAGIDMEWWVRMLAVTKLRYIDKELYDYTYSWSGAAARAVRTQGIYVARLWICDSLEVVARDPAIRDLAASTRRRLLVRTAARVGGDIFKNPRDIVRRLRQIARFLRLSRQRKLSGGRFWEPIPAVE